MTDGPLRILHVVPSYLPATVYGGTLESVHGLCKGLARLGHEVHVLTTSRDGERDLDVPLGTPVALDGVNVHYYPVRHLRRLFWAPSMAEGLARELERSSIVHVHSVYQWPVVTATRAAYRARVPYVLAPRGMLVPELMRGKSRVVKAAWLELFGRTMVARAARLHLTSVGEQNSARRLGIELPPVCIVPNGVDLPDESEDSPANPGLAAVMAEGPYCVFLGRLSWEKGLDRLFAAMAGTTLRLLIAGQGEAGYRAKLEGLVAEHALVGQVTFVGQVTGADKWALLRGARFLVLPSYSENFGNVVVEAMGVGCPALVTEEVGAAEVVQRANGGRVSQGDSEALRAALLSIDADAPARRELGESGQRYVREHLSQVGVAAAMEQCYRSVLAQTHAGLRASKISV